jgi:ubiquinone/menaquinone biosynthesis C-methylase UbiE
MPNYGSKKYWNERYLGQMDKNFDWLENLNSLLPLINKYINKEDRILMVGCGNSTLSEDMYDEGFHRIVNIDISDVVIETMKQRNHATRPEMKWLAMDALDLNYEECCFDVVLDKSTLDAILCGEMSFIHAAVMLKEIQRVLKVGGKFLSISYGTPEYRVFHFRRKHLSFDIECYVLSKVL